MKKRIMPFVAACLALAMIVGSWAYFKATNEVKNELKTVSGYGTTLTEKFTPPKSWIPGAEVTKEVGVKNTGDAPVVVRIKLKEDWQRSNVSFIGGGIDSTATDGADKITTVYQNNLNDGLVTSDKTVVEKTLPNIGGGTGKWTLGQDGWWYYNEKVDAGDATAAFLSAIKLNDDTDMGTKTITKYYTYDSTLENVDPSTGNIGTTPGNKWVVYTTATAPAPTSPYTTVYTRTVSGLDASAAGYANADYSLYITSETCQATADAAKDAFTNVNTDTWLSGVWGAWGLS